MNKYIPNSEDHLNNLGNILISWVKKVHEKKISKQTNQARENAREYTDLISLEMKGNKSRNNKASVW